jgi:hypothetical protein
VLKVLQQRPGAGASLAVGARIVIVRTSLVRGQSIHCKRFCYTTISQFGNSVTTVRDSPLFDFFGVAIWEGWAGFLLFIGAGAFALGMAIRPHARFGPGSNGRRRPYAHPMACGSSSERPGCGIYRCVKDRTGRHPALLPGPITSNVCAQALAAHEGVEAGADVGAL